jgi:hypothetical protein
VAGQRPLLGEDGRRLGGAALGELGRQAELGQPPLPAREVERAEHREHERQVLGGDEVQRSAHRPHPHDRGTFELHRPPRDEREAGGGSVLGLDADEGADDLGGGGGRCVR